MTNSGALITAPMSVTACPMKASSRASLMLVELIAPPNRIVVGRPFAPSNRAHARSVIGRPGPSPGRAFAQTRQDTT